MTHTAARIAGFVAGAVPGVSHKPDCGRWRSRPILRGGRLQSHGAGRRAGSRDALPGKLNQACLPSATLLQVPGSPSLPDERRDRPVR
jgi:hypothetical protein